MLTFHASRLLMRIGVMTASSALVLAGLTTAETASAQAHELPGYFTATAAPQIVDNGHAQQSFTVTLTNCNVGISGCTAASGQTLGSANIAIDAAFTNVSATVSQTGWQVVTPVVGGVVQLRSNTHQTNGLAPGASLTVTIVADTPQASGIYTWTTSALHSSKGGDGDNDGDDQLFTLGGSQPQIAVGLPDHLVFVSQPSNVQVSSGASTSDICPPPSIEVVTADGTVVTSGTASVTLLADTAFGDPGLGGTTATTASAGVATFGTANCTGGVDATHVGGGFRLQATGTWTFNGTQISLATKADSNPFDVVQVLTPCAAGASCGGTTQGAHTSVTVTTTTAPTAGQLEIAVGIDSYANTTCHPLYQPTGLQVTRVVADNRGKTVTLTFDKSIVGQKPLYLIFFFPICFSAPWGGWVTDNGRPATLNTTTDEYEGLLPVCWPWRLPAGNPCIASRWYNPWQGSETVTVSIPFMSGRADPKLW